MTLSLRDAQTDRWSLPPTDAGGNTEQDVEADAWTACVLPKHLQTPEALEAVRRSNPGSPDPFASFRIVLGEVTAGTAGKPVELHLPAEWGR